MTAINKAEGQATITYPMPSLLGVIRKWGPLFLISSLSLYLELAVIRWISGEVRFRAKCGCLLILKIYLCWLLFSVFRSVLVSLVKTGTSAHP